MKICYVSGANSRHIQRWLKWMVNKNHEVHLITEHDNYIDGVLFHFLPKKKPGLFNFYEKMRITKKFIKQIKPDIVHAHYIFGYGTFASYSGFHPLVLTAWGSDILVDTKNTKNFFGKYLVKYALEKADVILCEGDNVKNCIIKKMGIEPRKIRSIYFGVNTQVFNPENYDKTVREKLGVNSSPMIISSKNLESIYDITTLIKAASVVVNKIPSTMFVIAGEGVEKNKLEDLVQVLNISNNVKFIGFIPINKYPKYLASSDIYVCTSLSDGGFAVSTKEAMSCGLPVVVTNLDVNIRWVKDGINGFVFPKSNSNVLAEKILYLIDNKDVCEKFGLNGRKLVMDNFEYDVQMKKTEDIYDQLVKKTWI